MRNIILYDVSQFVIVSYYVVRESYKTIHSTPSVDTFVYIFIFVKINIAI